MQKSIVLICGVNPFIPVSLVITYDRSSRVAKVLQMDSELTCDCKLRWTWDRPVGYLARVIYALWIVDREA